MNFFAIVWQFLAAAHNLRVNCDEMAGYRLRQLALLRIQFSALNADFGSPSADHLGSRTPAQAGVKYR